MFSCGLFDETHEGLPNMKEIPKINTSSAVMEQSKCKICENVFNSKVDLQDHGCDYYDNEKVFQCRNCAKTFQSQSSLGLHIKSIHEEKKYECKSCDKAFSQAGNLKKHIHTVHQGHKDYKCDSCGKSFTEA